MELVCQFLIGIEVGGRSQMHLVHCLACGVEELKAAAGLPAIACLDRKAVRPHVREDAQINVLAEHHGVMLSGEYLIVNANLLMHGTVIAGQRHHLADRLQTGQHIINAWLDAHRAKTAMCREKLRFRNAQLGGEIAVADFGAVFACPPDSLRRRFLALVHVFTPACAYYRSGVFALAKKELKSRANCSKRLGNPAYEPVQRELEPTPLVAVSTNPTIRVGCPTPWRQQPNQNRRRVGDVALSGNDFFPLARSMHGDPRSVTHRGESER
ncbi:hypothetical protein MESS2_980047 [Mesorhizobium metallidurans STM 2683]|uniref:Uncharacterized protein n=1 Tax=Mesorhizobium metallidurans STM 2683 TaxID=1297569 RepID=M5EZH3_9HYPH|nr:hypothetical protein MESS2_980047 [Mesorhizobium metallidurans STM 2683]